MPIHFTLAGSVSLDPLPLWLSPPPPLGAAQTLWSILPVGADFLAHKHKPSMVAQPLFCKQKSKPLTACFMCAFLKSPTEQIAQRGVQSARADTRVLGSVSTLTSGQWTNTEWEYISLCLLGNKTARKHPYLLCQNFTCFLVDFFLSVTHSYIASLNFPRKRFDKFFDYPALRQCHK